MIGTFNLDTVDMMLRRGEAFRVEVREIGKDGLVFEIPKRGKYEAKVLKMKPTKWQLAKVGDMLTVHIQNDGALSVTQVLEIVRLKDGEIADRILCKD